MAEVESNRERVTRELREDWGTVKNFCKQNGLSYYSYLKVIANQGSSKKVLNALVEHGYIDGVDAFVTKTKEER